MPDLNKSPAEHEEDQDVVAADEVGELITLVSIQIRMMNKQKFIKVSTSISIQN